MAIEIDTELTSPSVVIVVPPFRAPTAPALGPALLKAVVEENLPTIRVHVLDANLELLSRALDGNLQDLCGICRRGGLACPRPGLLGERLRWVGEQLRKVPTTPAEFNDHMRAALVLDGFVETLVRCSEALLRPYVEGRTGMAGEVRDIWFGPILDKISRLKPRLIGLSVLSEQSLLWSLAMGRIFSEELDAPVALGGALISHLDPEELLSTNPWIDLVFSGEAENALPKYLEQGDEELESVPSLTHRKGGSICVHPPDLGVVLDTLPTPDFTDTPLDGYFVGEPILPYSSSRGCSWGRCRFCTHPRPHGKGVRFRAVEKIIEDLSTLELQTGARTFLFVDENLRAQRVSRLTAALEERDVCYRFGFEGIRPEAAFTSEVLDAAYRAGLRWVYVGLESTTQRLLDLVDKGIRVEEAESFLKRCDSAGIATHCSYIVGLPTQTLAELDEELDRMSGRVVDAGPFSLLYGSRFHETATSHGIQVDEREVLILGAHGIIHGPRLRFTVDRGVSPEQAFEHFTSHSTAVGHRPHLGECDAVILSSTSFFDSDERPDDLPGVVMRERWRAVEFAPPGFGRTLDRLSCLEAAGRFDTAVEESAREAAKTEKWKDRSRLVLHTATCLLELRKLPRALELFQELGGDSPVAIAAATQTMRVALSMGDMSALRRAAQKVWRQGIATHRVCLGLALAAMAARRFDDAERYFTMSAALGSPNPDADRLHAQVCFALGRVGDGERLAAKAERRLRTSRRKEAL